MTAAAIRLLVLEDNPSDALLVQVELANCAPGEFSVTVVGLLEDALLRIDAAHFDVVLCDLGLPDSTGLAAVQAIRSRAPAMPLVVFTGLNDDELGKQAIRYGAQDYLVKGESRGWLIARTIRYSIERKLSESQLRLAASVFDHALEAITITDADANILAVNRRFTEITGYAPEEVIGQNPRILKSGRQGSDFYRAMWQALLSEGRWAGEIWNRGKDGRIYPEQISISAVRDAGGKTVNYVAVFSDLTQRIAAEQAIRTSESRYRTMFDEAPEGVWLVAPDMRTIEVNRRLTELLGYRAEEIRGRLPTDFADEKNRKIFEAQIRLVPVTPQREYEIELRHKNGHNIPTHFNVSNLYAEDGSLMGALAFVIDLTERMRHEEELRRLNEELEQRVEQRTHALQVANRELESFCYSVSHDLRSPLRAINGFSRVIEEDHAGNLDEHGKALLRRVSAAADRMGNLIEDLLKLSRISRQDMHRIPVDLSSLARGVVEELHAAEPLRQVEWLIAPAIRATGDAGLLRVALHNLLGNALKYSAKRDTTRIEFGVAEKDGRSVYFVRDNGAGFDMAYADKLFGAFQRLHSPAEFPGTGIGLATVARIVQRHGGEVWAEGKLGGGSSFFFTL